MSSLCFRSPREVSECLVGLGHSVGVGSGLHGLAFTTSRVHQLLGETDVHGLALVFADRGDEPAERE